MLERPESRFRAERFGGREFIGWDEDRRLFAAIHDLIRFLLPALGGVKVQPDSAWKRPSASQPTAEKDPVGTIADFNAAKFLAGNFD